MTKSFDEVVSNYRDPLPEWTVKINGKNYSNNLELLEFTDSVNNPLKFTVKLSGVNSSDNIPEDAEVIVSRGGGELFRGVLKEVEPDVLNTYTFKGTGYTAELEGDVDQRFQGSTVTNIVDTLIDGTTTNTNVSKTFSTSYDISSTTVEDFRAKKDQLGEVNRLMGEYDLEWYTTYNGSNQPVFNVTSQISFTDGGNPLDTITTYGANQTAEMVKQNANRNKGDFDGVLVRGYGDGGDQITATSGNTGKGNRVLIYTDKTIVTQEQAQKRADNLKNTKTVSWQEIEVKPNNPNKIYGVGDELKVESKDARLNDTYRVVKSYFKIWPGEDQFESKLNLSNKPQTFIDDFKKQENQTDSQTDYMQGSRNVWGEKETGNATNAEPLTIDLYIPPDVNDITNTNRVNGIKLNYSAAAYRKSNTSSDVRVSSTNLTTNNKVDSTNTTSSNKLDSVSDDEDPGVENDNGVDVESGSQTQVGSVAAGGASVIEKATNSRESITIDQNDGWTDFGMNMDAGSSDSAGAVAHCWILVTPDTSHFTSNTINFAVDWQLRLVDENGDTYPDSSGVRFNTQHPIRELGGTRYISNATANISIPIPVNTDLREYDFEINATSNVDGGIDVSAEGDLWVYGEHSHDVEPVHDDSGILFSAPGSDGSVNVTTRDWVYDTDSSSSSTVDSVSDNSSSTVDDVSDNTQSTVVSVSEDLVAGNTANNVQIKIDGTDRTTDIYGSSPSPNNQDAEINITDYFTDSDGDGKPDVGWHTVEIIPDSATFLKSRVFLDHKKDTNN